MQQLHVHLCWRWLSLPLAAFIQTAAPVSVCDQSHGARTRRLQATKKAAALPAFALIDAGGGVLVDLDVDGNEIYSERKVYPLRAGSPSPQLRTCAYVSA
jgi:hypothetical protein